MLAEVGSILIGLSLFASLFAAVALNVGLKNKVFPVAKSARNALYGSTGLLLVACSCC